MRRCPPPARIARCLCAPLGLFLVGCMPLGYAYPKVSYIPPGSVGTAPDQVYAFRVDITNDDSTFETTENDRYVLSRLPLHRDGRFDPQTKVAVDYGCILYCMANVYEASTHHSLRVRLYRPGYHTLEIEPWQESVPLPWTEARKLEEREQAIDDLVSTWNTTPERIQTKAAFNGFVPPRDPIVFQYLAPGSVSPEHRGVLIFAATEYDRLLPAAADAETRARLQAKAVALREMAAK